MNWRDRIVSDVRIHHGRACIKGTRVPVATILDNLAAGLTPEQVIASYPAVTLDDVRAAVSYAADLTNERVIDITPRETA